ncbi:MAG: DUF5627 domain-containing protein [Tannerella sp.]|jgi:hypothetical protein|nr:DUF5627 domain-containing protein [Tannerella sp.]
MKKYLFILLIIINGIFTSCKNGDWNFSDYEYTAVYFAYQTPIRTIVLGEDVYDTSLDNEHKCQIIATMGGVYENMKDVEIGFRVDNSLCANLTFNGTDVVVPMPTSYYSLSSSDKFVIPKKEILGRVTVQLTDAFFADPQALKNTYVIPLVMTDVKNADKILTGTPLVENPNRLVSDHWDVKPKDYILYCVKYINQWDASYLRRGKDQITKNGNTTTEIRHALYVEKDEVCQLSSLSLTSLEFPMDYKTQSGAQLDLKIKLNFDENQKCSVAPATTDYQINDSVKVYNITASGNGQYVVKGEKKSWGDKDRDALYLNYEVGYNVETSYPNAGLPTDIQTVKYSTVDTLVIRDRGIKPETFTPVY